MFKTFLKCIIPSILANVLQSLYCVVDAYFVGIKTGDPGLASVSIAWPINALIIATGIGVGTGGAVLISTFLGKGEKKESRIAERETIILLLIMSVFCTVFFMLTKNIFLPLLGADGQIMSLADDYITVLIGGAVFTIFGSGMLPVLRNRGKLNIFTVIMILSMVMNVIGDYLLIFVFDWGIVGAAAATIAAQAVAAILSLIVLIKENREDYVSVTAKDIKQNLYVKKIFSIGLSPFVIYFAPSLALIITNIQCLNYGDESVVAAYATMTYLTFPLQRVVGGIAEGCQPLFSFYYGKGNLDYISKLKKICYISALILGAVIAVILIFTSRPLGTFFGISEKALSYFVQGMTIISSLFLCVGYTKIIQSFLFATLNEKKSAFLLLVESIIVAPATLILLPITLDINGIWIATAVTPYIMCIFSFIVNRITTRKIYARHNLKAVS